MIKNNHQFAWIYQAYTVPLLYKRYDMNKKKSLPKHRQLLMESMELLFSGKKAEFKKTVKKAKLEVDKFYSK